MTLFLFCFALALVPLALTQNALLGPCRSWVDPCDHTNVCTTAKALWRSIYMPSNCWFNMNFTALPPDLAGDCLVSEGTCQFVNSTVECATWLDTCQLSRQCGTVQEFENFLQLDFECPLFYPIPPPDSLCVPINGTCQWYNPCRSWRGFCYSPYVCGTEDQYWAFTFAPQPECIPLPDYEGWVEPVAPGDCIMQNGACTWSDCTAWMDACQTSWMCGSEYKRQLYEAQQHHPPAAACPYPSPDPNYPPPTQPAPCTFNQQQGQCQFKACVNGMVYESCGSACPLTCKNINSTSSCIEVCSEGCFCPSGLVQLGDTCVQPSECPCADQSCPEGSVCRVHAPTGVAVCEPTCEVNNGGCASDQTCSLEEGQCATQPCPRIVNCACPDGKEYQPCASACPPTCDYPESFCDACGPGCACSQGTVALGDTCVVPSDCPTGLDDCALILCDHGYECMVDPVTRQGFCQPSCSLDNGGCRPDQRCQLTQVQCVTTPCPPIVQCFDPVTDPCAVVDCQQYQYCEVSSVTGDAVCVPSCELENGGCRSDQICTIEEYDCFSTNGDPCDPNQYIQCKNSPYVPCSSASLDCPSHSRCLTQSTTEQSICLQSCYRDNGGCAAGDVCVTELLVDDCQYGEECETDVTCRSLNALDRDCPAGKERTECGTACPETCETYVAQEIRSCITLCVGGCFCPQGLVVYRDRCVDPKECYSLLQDPPALNPLPIDQNSVLLELRVSDLSFEDFSSATQDLLTQSVERLLEREGYSTVTVTIHTAYEDQQLLVVLMITGGNVEYSKADEIASVILDNQHNTPLSLDNVSAVDAPLLTPSLSTGAIAGIAVAAVLVVVILGVGVAVGMARCIVTNRSSKGDMHVANTPAEENVYGALEVSSYSTLQHAQHAPRSNLDVKPPLGLQ